MGICCAKCRSRADRRKYLRTRYNVERELSLEFENLMEEDTSEITMPQYGAVLTDEERKLVSDRKFQDLVRYQKRVDSEIEAQLHEQEENLRLEEESFREAKRQAARVAKKLKEQAASKPAWISKSEEILNGDEDFEEFLDSVRKRSLSTKPGTSGSLRMNSGDTHSWNRTPSASKTSDVWSADFGLDGDDDEEFVAAVPATQPLASSSSVPATGTSAAAAEGKVSGSSSEAER